MLRWTKRFISRGAIKKVHSARQNFRCRMMGIVRSIGDDVNTAMWSGGEGAGSWHTDNIADLWMQYRTRSRMGSSASQDPTLAPPSIETTGPVLEDISARLFLIVLGINNDICLLTIEASTTRGKTFTQAHRVFMSRPMFDSSQFVRCSSLLCEKTSEDAQGYSDDSKSTKNDRRQWVGGRKCLC